MVLLGIGLVYGWSVFVEPLEREFGWQRSDTSLTFTISMSALCIGLLIGGYINKSSDKPVLTLAVSGVLIFTGFFFTSNAMELWEFYAFYGIFSGLGTGLAYVEIIAVCGMIFPKKKGLMSGLLFMAFGLGALVLGTLCSSLMDIIGWRAIFRGTGILFGALIIAEGFILKTECRTNTESNAEASLSEDNSENVPTLKMIRKKEFILFYIWLIFISSSGLAMMAHIAPYIVETGSSTEYAAMIAGVVSMCNGLGRVIYGIAYDKLKVTSTMIIISAVFIISAVIIVLSSVTGSTVLLVGGCVLIGLSFGGAPISSSVVVSSLYGTKFYSSNFGAVSTQVMISSVLGPYISSRFYMWYGNYNSTFYAIMALSIVNILVLYLFLKSVKKSRSIHN